MADTNTSDQPVSIHTRHFWRVNPELEARLFVPMQVSIHTRHFWRVNRKPLAGTAGAKQVSIHTRHFWRVNPFCPGWKSADRMFQSTPAISGG